MRMNDNGPWCFQFLYEFMIIEWDMLILKKNFTVCYLFRFVSTIGVIQLLVLLMLLKNMKLCLKKNRILISVARSILYFFICFLVLLSNPAGFLEQLSFIYFLNLVDGKGLPYLYNKIFSFMYLGCIHFMFFLFKYNVILLL